MKKTLMKSCVMDDYDKMYQEADAKLKVISKKIGSDILDPVKEEKEKKAMHSRRVNREVVSKITYKIMDDYVEGECTLKDAISEMVEALEALASK